MRTICGLKKEAPGPYICSPYIKKGATTFCTCYTKTWIAERDFNFSCCLGICFCV